MDRVVRFLQVGDVWVLWFAGAAELLPLCHLSYACNIVFNIRIPVKMKELNAYQISLTSYFAGKWLVKAKRDCHDAMAIQQASKFWHLQLSHCPLHAIMTALPAHATLPPIVLASHPHAAMQVGAFPNPVMFPQRIVKFAVDIEEHQEKFFVQDLPGKGKGIVAARAITKGEYLFSESPLFTLSPSPTNSTILGALTKCTREEQQQYFALANSYKSRLLPALAIFETNFLLLGNGTLQTRKVQDSAGIFLLASRFNSSCTPNVSKSWDDIHNVMVFRTLRDVAEGEELCFNYCGVLGTKEERKRELLEDFGFECICSACQLEGEEALESDKRRSTIARLFDEVGQCGKEPTLGIRKIKLALKMLREEGLVHYEASFCYDAFQFCVLVSDFTNAKAWIRRAHEVSVYTSGSDSNAARKGKGIIAQRRFGRGEIVIAEAPIFTLLAEDLIQSGTSAINAALSRCTVTQREAFYGLSNAHPGMSTERGIFQTNVLPCGSNDSNSGHRAIKGAIFLLGSRLNSSCVPNVNNSWDESTGRLVFRVVRDVEAGDELCIAYGNILATRERRRKELKARFSFICECEACSLDGRALEESDHRRACLGGMYRDHARGVDGEPMEALGEAMLALRYLREECLVVHASAFYRTGFTFCAAVSDYANAMLWAEKAYGLICTACGEHKAELWKSFARNPRIFEHAGTLGRRTLAGPDAAAWTYLGLT
ncbi:hypothetical protein NM688_g7611 [Phlebia brevispora]|uniref:Uncharacterized protein n=1 Tax=Phlebia brevispora TaxID=194682 RepID=A0ACC1S3S8_9APHY|nr:hypothetical protein NM688_g7611 [Phlebia brevispora]